MQISKWHLVVCAAAFCASVLTVRADDNPAQAAARAALEAKMRQLNTQPATTNAQISVPANTSPTPPAAAMPQPPVQPTAATTAPPASAPVENSQATSAEQAAALAALEQKMNELNAGQTNPSRVTVTPSGATAPAPSNPPAASTMSSMPPRTATTTASSGSSFFEPVPPPSGGIPPGAALQGNVPSPTSMPQPVPMQPPQAANAYYPGKQLGLQPIVAPPLPISAAQQAQLQALLEKYDANVITPEQYQAARKKILAEHQ